MLEIDYRQDFIVIWEMDGSPVNQIEGFTEEGLTEYHGETYLEKIQAMFYEYNHGQPPDQIRTITKIEQVTRTTIFKT